jgi:hypothetical protein
MLPVSKPFLNCFLFSDKKTVKPSSMNQKANVIVPQLGTNPSLPKTVQQSADSERPKLWRFSWRLLTALDVAAEDGRKLTANSLAAVLVQA